MSGSRAAAKVSAAMTSPPGSTSRPPDVPTSRASVLSLESLTAAWPELVAAARERSILLGQALEVTTPSAAGNGEVQLGAPAAQAVLVEGLQRQLPVIDELIGSRFGTRVKVRVLLETPPGKPTERPKRMTDETLRAERLDRLRRMDPALDTAANELDLEIVDDSPRSP